MWLMLDADCILTWKHDTVHFLMVGSMQAGKHLPSGQNSVLCIDTTNLRVVVASEAIFKQSQVFLGHREVKDQQSTFKGLLENIGIARIRHR